MRKDLADDGDGRDVRVVLVAALQPGRGELRLPRVAVAVVDLGKQGERASEH